MTYDIAISIINYRTADLTVQCVQSVLADMGSLNAHIVVVDNKSDDGSAEAIEAWIAAQSGAVPVTLVRSEVNSGFSGGHNIGIAAVEAAFYLVLNSDATLRPGFLGTILEATKSNPDFGLYAPRIEYDDGGVQDSCFRFPNPFSELTRSAQTGLVTRLFNHKVVSLGPEPDISQIEWASFACILLRREMIEALGEMDEGYFLYYEDVEYCLRARRAGWNIHYVPAAVAVHFRGGSGPVKALAKERARLPKYFYSSRTRFLYQAHGRVGLIAANVFWYLGRCIKNSTRILGRKVPPLPAQQGRDIWINVSQPLGPRYAPWEENT